jgi:hypothetical protein
MQKAESRLRRLRRSYCHFTAGLGLLGFFLIVAGRWPGDWAWIFAVAGFVAFVLFTRQALAPWSLDRLVFNRQAFRRTTRTTASEWETLTVPSRKTPAEPHGPRVLPWQPKTTLSAGHRGGS